MISGSASGKFQNCIIEDKLKKFVFRFGSLSHGFFFRISFFSKRNGNPKIREIHGNRLMTIVNKYCHHLLR